MFRFGIALGAMAAFTALLVGCGGAAQTGAGTPQTVTVTRTETATQTQTETVPATGTETTGTVPTPETAPPQQAGFVDPCQIFSASDIQHILGGHFKKGVARRPGEGAKECFWESRAGDKFVSVVTFESARAFPGGWRRLSKDTWSAADTQAIFDFLGIDRERYASPQMLTWGCWRPNLETRNEPFAIVLFALGRDLTERESLELAQLGSTAQSACEANVPTQ